MKTTFTKIIAVTLVCLMMFALVSCDKSSAVKKAFEKAEYTVSTVDTNNNIAKGILTMVGFTDEQMEEIGEYEIILCVNGLKSAVVIKFPSSGDLKDFLTIEKDGEKDTKMYDDAKEADRINGNCLIITASDDAKEIFQKA